MFATWSCPLPDGSVREEMALAFDRRREHRVLVLPAWFDEANKMRRQTVEVMRRLDLSGIDSVLPDLPGCNESQARLERQTLASLCAAAAAAAEHFRATHLLTVRAGVLFAPETLPGWRYAPTSGRQTLRALLRARSIASREAGGSEKIEELQELGRAEGVTLAGWNLGSELFRDLEVAQAPDLPLTAEIEQDAIGGAGLWLRAEPDENPEQADALAAIIAMGLVGR